MRLQEAQPFRDAYQMEVVSPRSVLKIFNFIHQCYLLFVEDFELDLEGVHVIVKAAHHMH